MTVSDELALLLERVANGDISGYDALREIDANFANSVDWNDQPFARTYHFLQHFAADVDIRAKDAAYAEHQMKALKKLVEKLRR